MNLGQVIAEADLLNPNNLTNEQKTIFINRLEGEICANIIRSIKSLNLTLSADVSYYNIGQIPSLNVTDVVVNDNYLGHFVNTRTDFGYNFTTEGNDTIINFNKPINGEAKVFYQETKARLDYDSDKLTVLTIPAPYDDIYVTYLEAMIYKQNKEYGDYNNHLRIYDQRMQEFLTWNIKRSPKNKTQYKVVL
jgi:hypothetical protein